MIKENREILNIFKQRIFIDINKKEISLEIEEPSFSVIVFIYLFDYNIVIIYKNMDSILYLMVDMVMAISIYV